MNDIIWYIKRRYIYNRLIDEITDLCYRIKHVYPTKCRCMYEAFMFWEEMNKTIDEYIYGYGFYEFKKLRKYKRLTYQCIKN